MRTGSNPMGVVIPAHRPLIVTGAARSGTGYCSRWLEAATGEPCGHEQDVEYDFNLEWNPKPPPLNVSWLAAPRLSDPDPPYKVEWILLVRNPLDSINSNARRGHLNDASRYGRFAREQCFPLHDRWRGDHLERAVEYWVAWNRMILDARPDITIWRVEDLAAVGPPTIPTNYNAGDTNPDAPQASGYQGYRLSWMQKWAEALGYPNCSGAPIRDIDRDRLKSLVLQQ